MAGRVVRGGEYQSWDDDIRSRSSHNLEGHDSFVINEGFLVVGWGNDPSQGWPLYRIAAVVIEIAQLVVTSFGGGNGDLDVLRRSTRKTKTPN
jgi:hypothetical protein